MEGRNFVFGRQADKQIPKFRLSINTLLCGAHLKSDARFLRAHAVILFA